MDLILAIAALCSVSIGGSKYNSISVGDVVNAQKSCQQYYVECLKDRRGQDSLLKCIKDR